MTNRLVLSSHHARSGPRRMVPDRRIVRLGRGIIRFVRGVVRLIGGGGGRIVRPSRGRSSVVRAWKRISLGCGCSGRTWDPLLDRCALRIGLLWVGSEFGALCWVGVSGSGLGFLVLVIIWVLERILRVVLYEKSPVSLVC
jgi:hypothetical protein